MKVLLNKENITLSRMMVDTCLIWLLTNFLGSICFWLFTGIGGAFFLSSLFSIPVLLLAIPNFYILYSIQKRKNRIAYALLSVLLLSVLLFVLLGIFFHDDLRLTQLAAWMSPYAAAAEISFFMVTSEYLLKKNERTDPTTHEI